MHGVNVKIELKENFSLKRHIVSMRNKHNFKCNISTQRYRVYSIYSLLCRKIINAMYIKLVRKALNLGSNPSTPLVFGLTFAHAISTNN